MTMPKPAAELSASLLVKKGAAQPMAFVATRGLRPVAAASPAPWMIERPEPADDLAGRAKLSLRLDPQLHLRLKVTAAHLRMSRQDVMVAALNDYLARTGPALEDGCLCARPDRGPTSGVRL